MLPFFTAQLSLSVEHASLTAVNASSRYTPRVERLVQILALFWTVVKLLDFVGDMGFFSIRSAWTVNILLVINCFDLIPFVIRDIGQPFIIAGGTIHAGSVQDCHSLCGLDREMSADEIAYRVRKKGVSNALYHFLMQSCRCLLIAFGDSIVNVAQIDK
jgi:hypothetical protein